jgi:hypothetical protein
VPIGKIQLGVASGGSANVADPPDLGVPAAPFAADPPLDPLQALTAKMTISATAAPAVLAHTGANPDR